MPPAYKLPRMDARTDLPLLLMLLFVVAYLETLPPRSNAPAFTPELSNPILADAVPVYILLPVGLFVPPLIYYALSAHKSLLAFAVTLFEALLFTVFFTNSLKLIIARPRPYYATVCAKYVDNVCTGNAHAVAEALKSFPSGHSSYSFCAATILSQFLTFHFRAAATWRQLVVFSPYMVAALVAASRIVDFHHHYADIVAGCVLGIGVAIVVFQVRKDTFLQPSLLPIVGEV